jgi:ketosteroid isomerase-like protein
MKNTIQVKCITFSRFTTVILLFFALTGCHKKSSQTIDNPIISNEDKEKIKNICKDYTNGWLENDYKKVLGLYADSATIIPSGLGPIQGIQAITDFWFPNDSSITVIHYYDLEILDISGTTNQAYSYEHGKLSFTYEKDDFKLDREAESYAITIYEKGESGEWKIVKRMWTDMNK